VALIPHLLLGAGLYFLLAPWLVTLSSEALVKVALVVILGGMAVRAFRFGRIGEVLRAGPQSRWGILAVLSLLGPAESLIPILAKASHLGGGYVLTLGAFALGSLCMGSVLVVVGRVLWDQPQWLPRGLSWGRRGTTLLPVIFGLAVGLDALLKI
jgi:hypothetical protein